MPLKDVAMVAANTARSKAYLQALVQNGLAPSHVLLMRERAATPLPGQSAAEVGPQEASKDMAHTEYLGLRLRPHLSLEGLLRDEEIPFTEVPSADINSGPVIEALRERSESTFVYSGVGGQILRAAVLGVGKRFLHVHGGFVPNFKGSTTNYYSLLAERRCGASAIFLTAELDAGPVLMRRRFPPPPDRTLLDYVYDPLFRARVLVDVLAAYARTGSWPCDADAAGEGETYFVIHPVLRHIAMLAG
jgi:methionyl-tRNA formyltransferase